MRVVPLLLLLLAAFCAPAAAAPTESLDEAVCRLIDASAKDKRLPVELFARLIWRAEGGKQQEEKRDDAHMAEIGASTFPERPGLPERCKPKGSVNLGGDAALVSASLHRWR